MQVNVNGESRELPEATTLAALVETLGLNPKMVVAQRNAEIVERAAFAGVVLEPGDEIELIRFVGGG
jgi:thiamine biosynthesis protein ThiS